MSNKEEIVSFIDNNIKKSRLAHIYRVAAYAKKLARIHGLDEEKAEIAGLLHDSAKGIEAGFSEEDFKREEFLELDFEDYPQFIHAGLAVILAREKFGIRDEDILNAVKYHSTSRPGASELEKIIFLADKLEPSRPYEERDYLESIAFESLDEGVLETLNANIIYLINKKSLIHPLALDARNYLLKNGGR